MKKLRTKILRMIIYIGKWLLNIIYFFIKMCPTKNKVVMLSRQSNKPSIDFLLIQNEISKRAENVEVKVLCKVLKKGFIDRINYSFYILKCMYHIATAKVCILDGYQIPISILKHKKNLEIIQIWHASGAIKKFGYQSLNKKEGRGKEIAKIMNMHKNYSHVMAPSSTTAKFYAEAFDVDIDKIFINGLPRLDYILSKELGKEKLEEFYNEYTQFKNKKTILYIPTYRKSCDCSDIINKIASNINFEKYNLIIKLHPLDKSNEINEYKVDKKYNTFDLLKIADYIITDYSAVAFEASVLNKPLYFYVYDINEYKEARGLNVDLLKEMNNSTSTNINEIIESIENNQYDYKELETFRKKYVENCSCNNTERLIDFVLKFVNKDVNNEKNKNMVNEYSKK